MRRIAISILLLAYATVVKAQPQATSWENNNNVPSGSIQQDNEFAITEMNEGNNGRITMSDLPRLNKSIWAIVTDAQGNVMAQKRLTQSDNNMDLHRLPKNAMYFVTLIYRNKSKKAFVLHM